MFPWQYIINYLFSFLKKNEFTSISQSDFTVIVNVSCLRVHELIHLHDRISS